MLKNPILPGFNSDPCICRKGDDYYLAVSTFEWMPGVTVYHSKDLRSWEILTGILDETKVDLRGLASSKGIWAPCLTYCEEDDCFWLVYGVMHSMNARYFDVDNYVIKSHSITGPWSAPVYLHSAGFDASMFHDDDGRKWVVSLEWETRAGYEQPGAICLVEYDPVQEKITGLPRRIYQGGTDRGCLEAPHLTKHEGYYYLMCAEGGTGYLHGVTIGRSSCVDGPYEPDPANPVLTSFPGEIYERNNPDHLKPQYYNPETVLQKGGHGSYVETPQGETYMVFHCSRPLLPDLRCTLGRETAIVQMKWTEDGWLRTWNDDPLAPEETPEPSLAVIPCASVIEKDDFDSPVLSPVYMAPRVMPQSFTDLSSRPGWALLRGMESQASSYQSSILARRLTSLRADVSCRMEFVPEVYEQNAGLLIYYCQMDWCYLRKYYSETLGGSAIGLVHLSNGDKTEYTGTRTPVEDRPIIFTLRIRNKIYWFEWGYDEEHLQRIGPEFDLSTLSDEYCRNGEFTGTLTGITCCDSLTHSKTAAFDWFCYKDVQD